MGLYLCALVVGLVIGSFLNVCIWRIPRGESLVTPSSHCPSCGRSISIYDNIPIVSFIGLRGRCRHCRLPISVRYPVVELINGVGYALLIWRYGSQWHTLVYALLFSALVVITFIDIDHQIIPDRITLPGMVLGLMAAAWVLPHGFWDASAGLLLGGGLFYLIAILSQGGMGGGDIKMIAMVGAFLGWKAVLLTIFLGALTGSLMGLFLILFHGKNRKTPVPFGPFLSLGGWVSIFFGQEIIQWYQTLSL